MGEGPYPTYAGCLCRVEQSTNFIVEAEKETVEYPNYHAYFAKQ